jgi:hypothetical protein
MVLGDKAKTNFVFNAADIQRLPPVVTALSGDVLAVNNTTACVCTNQLTRRLSIESECFLIFVRFL